MKLKRLKWLSALFSTLLVAIFEFARHQLMDPADMDEGNLLVAGFSGILFMLYFQGIFVMLEKTQSKLQKEREEASVLQERDRIARELHDSVAQALFFMNIKTAEIETALRQGRTPLTQVQELKDAIKLTDHDVRSHIFALQKVNADNVDLTATVRQYLAQYTQQCGIKVDLSIEGNINTKLNKQERSLLLRIFQEALVNIRKHAAATQVRIRLRADGPLLSLTIEDDGKGFDPGQLEAKPLSFGLKALENDARLLNAKLDIKSLLGQGTAVTVRLFAKEEGSH